MQLLEMVQTHFQCLEVEVLHCDVVTEDLLVLFDRGFQNVYEFELAFQSVTDGLEGQVLQNLFFELEIFEHVRTNEGQPDTLSQVHLLVLT